MPNGNKIDYFGKILIDLTGDNITPQDVRRDVIFHDKTGTPKKGELPTFLSGGYKETDGYEIEKPREYYFTVKIPNDKDTLFLTGSYLKLLLRKADFGSATPADVAKGKTFTSTSGLKIPGTAEPSSGTGPDLSDDTITPDDVVQGVTFHDKTGAPQAGTILNEKTVRPGIKNIIPRPQNDQIQFMGQVLDGKRHLVAPETEVYLSTKLSKFGNVTAAEVPKGKTFTSAAGFNIAGTAEPSGGGGGLPAVITPGDTPIIGDFSGKLIANKNVFEDSNILLIIPKTGKYRFYISVTAQGYDYSGKKPLISIRKNGNEISQQQVESDNFNAVKIEADCNANDQITVWGRAIGTYSTVTVDVISAVACIDWTIQ